MGKLRIYFAFILLVVILSCSRKSERSKGMENEDVTKTDSVAIGRDDIDLKGPASNSGKYEGVLDNKIQISVWFAEKGNVAKGEIIYKSSGIPIILIGNILNNFYYLSEFDKTGNVTGVLSFQASGDSLLGEWYSPANGKRLNLKLKKVIPIAVDDDFFAVGKTKDGMYKYQYGEEGAVGKIELKKSQPGTMLMNVSNLTAAPARNMAILKDAKLEINEDYGIYKNKSEFEDCEFMIRFYKDFIYVNYPDDKHECGFGHNAGVEGVYLKVK